MKSAQPAYLNLLVVPHPPDQDFAKLDAVTTTVHNSNSSRFKTVWDESPVGIGIPRDGKWRAIRNNHS